MNLMSNNVELKLQKLFQNLEFPYLYLLLAMSQDTVYIT